MRKIFSGVAIWLAFVISAPAAIQYAGGTNVNAQCTATAGTRQELSDCIQDNLTTAGWTVISGSHTTSVVMQSVSTPTAALQMRLSITQSTNCVNLKGQNVAGTKAATVGQFLLPGIGKVFRVIANKYQYFISTDGTPPNRSTAMCSTPYVPTFVGLTEAIICTGNGNSDTDTNLRPTWKISMSLNSSGISGGSWITLNGTQFEENATTGLGSGTSGFPSLWVPYNANLIAVTINYRWFDNSALLTDPLVSVGTSLAGEGKLVGLFWDAALLTDSVASETILVADSHNFLVWTNADAGAGGTKAKGSLILVVP